MIGSDQGAALVSVCIPSYNASAHIAETVRSVLNSTYPHFEIIVNDDASTDDTLGVVSTFNDRRITVFRNEENQGVPHNWNTALKRARGKYVSLLNHDDRYGPFWLTFAVHVLEKHPHIGWMTTAFHIMRADGRIVQTVTPLDHTGEHSASEVFRYACRLNGFGPGFIARREALESVGFYDEDAGPSADNELFIRLASRYPYYYSSYPHTAWVLHAGNLTHRWDFLAQTEDCLRILGKTFRDGCLPEELRQFERESYLYNYGKIVWHIQQRLALGDLETVRRVFRILGAEAH